MILDEVPRIIVIGDLHGDTQMLCTCLYMTNIINKNMEWIADPPNTVVIQMGDQIDSMTRADVINDWEKTDDTLVMRFTDKLDRIAKEKGGRFISMVGNHELMNVIGDYTYVSQLSMEKSGGRIGRFNKFKPNSPYARMIANRPCVLKIGKLLFCHAGILPHHLDISKNDLLFINELHKMYCLQMPMSDYMVQLHKELFIDPLSMLWNRSYVQNDSKMEKHLDEVLKRTECIAMIIGHNPITNITPIYNLKLWITDIGLSRAFLNDNIEVLEIINGKTFNVLKK
jgi:hypothetical protein